MVYGIDIIARDFKPLKWSVKFNLFGLVYKALNKWLINMLEDVNLKTAGLIKICEENKVVFWEEELNKLDSLITMVENVQELIPSQTDQTAISTLAIQSRLSAVAIKLHKLRELIIAGDDLTTTEYLNLNDANKAFLQKQIKESASVEVNI